MNTKTGETNHIYKKAIDAITTTKIPFLLGGAYALRVYTGIHRDTKDLDIFCKPKDCQKILDVLKNEGFKTEFTDRRWLGKGFYEDYLIDIIFSSHNEVSVVDDDWFRFAGKTELFGHTVPVIPPEEMIWSKAFVQTRDRFDGADIAHIILKIARKMDWHRLYKRFEDYPSVLLTHLINFDIIYPTKKGLIPTWLFNKLTEKVVSYHSANEKNSDICRGRLFSPTEYEIDFQQWGYHD